MSYAVKEIFLTLQGEGGQAGRRGGVLPLRRLQPVERARAGPRRAPSAPSATPTSSAWTARAAAASPTPRRWPTAVEAAVARAGRTTGWWCCTGGEPLLQLDDAADRRAARARLRDRGGDQRHAAGARRASTGSASAPRPTRRWCRPRGQELKLVYPAGRASIRSASRGWISSASTCSRWTGPTARRTPRRPSPIAWPTRAGV